MSIVRFLVMILIFLFFSCNNKKKVDYLDDYKSIVLDSLKVETNINYTSIFKSVIALPLETNDLCLIGEISQIDFTDNEIFILDMHVSKSLFVFNKKGQFLRKIGERGKGPGEYIQFSSFSIDYDRQMIFALDHSTRKIIQYTFEGVFVNEFFCSENSRPYQISVNDGYIYIDHFPFQKEKKENLLKIFDYNWNLINECFQFPDYNHGFSQLLAVGSAFSKSRSGVKYCKPFSDTIFNLENQKISPSFVFFTNVLVDSKEMKNINTNEGPKRGYFAYRGFKGANNYFECDSLIIFKFINKYSCNYLYWPKHNITKVANRLLDDMTLYDISKQFIGCVDNHVVSYVIGEDITSLIKKIESNSISISISGSFDINELTSNNNPVLLFYDCREKVVDN